MSQSARTLAEDPKPFYNQYASLPLDASAADGLKDEEIAFLKEQTGIDDDAAVKEHILRIRETAFKIHPYPCIRRLAFATLTISRHPVYPRVLEMGRTRPDALLLDLGCCVGNDARKAVADGYPALQVVASDLRPKFWDLGHELFRDSSRCPIKFIPGDVFDDGFFRSQHIPHNGAVDIQSATTLNDLQGHFGAIHASAMFHLFDEAQQISLATRIAAALSQEPGSVLFGSHGGVPDGRAGLQESRAGFPYAHSPSTFRALLQSVFPPGSVHVDVQGNEPEIRTIGFTAEQLQAFREQAEKEGLRHQWIVFSATRL